MITFPYISTTSSSFFFLFSIRISFCTRIIQHMSLWFNQIWPFGNKSSRKDINRKLILFHSIKPVYFQFACYYIKGEYYILSQSFKWRSCIPRRRKIWFWHFTRWEFQFIYKHCAYTWYLLFTINDEEEDEDDDGVHAAWLKLRQVDKFCINIPISVNIPFRSHPLNVMLLQSYGLWLKDCQIPIVQLKCG